jgi:hypothetical protein
MNTLAPTPSFRIAAAISRAIVSIDAANVGLVMIRLLTLVYEVI